MKKYLSVLIMLALLVSVVFVFSGCNEEKKAEKAVKEMFSSIKALDFEKAQKFMDGDNFYQGDDVKDLPEYAQIILNELCGNLEYKILESEKVNKNKVIVKTEITTLDISPIMTEFMKEAISSMMGASLLDKDKQEAELAKIAKKLMARPDLKTKTATVDIDVVNNDKGWVVVSSDEFENAMSGGLAEYTENMK